MLHTLWRQRKKTYFVLWLHLMILILQSQMTSESWTEFRTFHSFHLPIMLFTSQDFNICTVCKTRLTTTKSCSCFANSKTKEKKMIKSKYNSSSLLEAKCSTIFFFILFLQSGKHIHSILVQLNWNNPNVEINNVQSQTAYCECSYLLNFFNGFVCQRKKSLAIASKLCTGIVCHQMYQLNYFCIDSELILYFGWIPFNLELAEEIAGNLAKP